MLARCGAFAASLIAFFLVEMGDKTQVATVALASRFETLAPVVLGTTAGMMLVSVPTVLLCGAFTGQRFLTAARWVAAAAFAAMGVWTRSEEHTSELQSLMRISYAVFCLKKKKQL